MERLVLLVDDDKLPMKFYVKALQQKGFKVKQCLEPDSTLGFVEKKASQIDAIILDIMMPSGEVYKHEDTNEGLKTGVFLLKDIRRYCPSTPIVVLTNVKNPNTLNEFKGKPLLRVVQKMEYPPFELVDLVEGMVGEQQRKSDVSER